MKLRYKILIPSLLALLTMAAILHFYWVPIQVERAKQRFIEQSDRLLTTGQGNVVRNLLERDYAALYSSMDTLQSLFGHRWYNLTVYSESGKRLYPLFVDDKSEAPASALLIHRSHPLAIGGTTLGQIDVDIDWSAEQTAIEESAHELDRVILLLLAVLVVVNFFSNEQLLFRPFKRLKCAAASLAHGEFDRDKGPYIRDIPNDEVGELLQSFNDMAHSVIDQTSRLRVVIDTVVDGIIVADENGCIHEFSPAAETIFGFTRTETLGRNISILMPDELHDVHGEYLKRFESDPRSKGIFNKLREFTAKRKNGELFPIDLAIQDACIGKQRLFTAVVRDITERKRAEEQLRRSQQSLLAQAQKMAGLGSWEFDLQTKCLAWSDQSYRMLGLSTSDRALTFDAFCSHVHPDDLPTLQQAHDRLFSLHAPYDIEYRLVTEEGDLTHIHERSEIVYGTNDDPLKLIGSLLDVSKRVREAERLELARHSAEAATKAKSAFLANMSHEIRTPMNAIIGMVHLTQRTNLDDQQRAYVTKIHQAAQNLLEIINDILDVSKIESGHLKLEEAPVRLDALCSRIETVIGTMARTKGVAFALHLSDDLPASFVGDALRLSQVLINLGGNAVKFTPAGGHVTVHVQLEEHVGDSCVLKFSVVDDGVGMDPSQTEHLFQPFTQADSSTTRKYGGTGLGLAISKQLVDLMGGDIRVDSELGRGSTFTFTARVGECRGEAIAEVAESTEEDVIEHHRQRLRGKRILLVEDNALNRDVAVDLLRSLGLTVDIAHDGSQALAALEQQQFDGILMDCMMPVMDGFEATRRLRKDPRYTDLPVIAMTANVMAEDREKCRAAGMNDHIGKPLDVDAMLATIAKWISPAIDEAPLTPLVNDTNAAFELPGIDVARGLEVARGRLPFYRKLLHRFSDDQRDFEKKFRAAQVDPDPNAALRAAHSLKGVAANIGAHTLCNHAAALESACKAETDSIEQRLNVVLTELDTVIDGITQLERSTNADSPSECRAV